MFVVRDNGVEGLSFALEHDSGLWGNESAAAEFLSNLLAECDRRPFGGPDDTLGKDVVLDLGRDAYFVVGVDDESDGSTLRVRRTPYLNLLLMSPMVHPAVDAYLDRRWRDAYRSFRKRRAFGSSADLNLRTLAQFRQNLLNFLDDREIAPGIARLAWPRPLVLGVAGCVILPGRHEEPGSMLAVRRSNRVAIAAGAFGPPVDGGLRPETGAITVDLLAASLRIEAVDELGDFPDMSWSLAGISLLDDASRSGGLTFAFVAHLDSEGFHVPDKLRHFEAEEVVSVVIGDTSVLRGSPTTQVLRDVMESLSDANRVGTSLQLTAPPSASNARRPNVPDHERTDRKMAAMSLEDRFSDDLIGGFPRLDRASRAHPEFGGAAGERLKNIAEDLAGDPTEDHVQEALDLLIRIQLEFRLAIDGTDQVALRQGRLFEALVYRVSREMLLGKRSTAQRVLTFLDDQSREADHCGLVGERWSSVMSELTVRAETQTHDLTESNLRFLAEMEAREQALGFNPVTTDLRLLLFCCNAWIMEALSQLGGPALALDEGYRRAFSSNPDALHFKSRALLIDPVLPDYRILLGRQFALSSLRGHNENAGVWHTMGLYELRAATTSIWADKNDGLEASLAAVTSALALDPEFPTFYHTRATIEKLLGRDDPARISLEAAIELSRFMLGAEAASEQTSQWVRLLESWR